MDDLIKALQIMSKYMNGYQRAYPTHCGHDVMYVSCNPKDVSDEDKEALNKLGFIPSTDVPDVFLSFKYGSA